VTHLVVVVLVLLLLLMVFVGPGNEDVKRLCSNPTLTGESRFQVGCRGK
jgi:hypothetical protein